MTEEKKVLATIYVMGKAYKVPNTLTIMKAIEYVGYRYVRSCGCRGGFCGACTTFYRVGNDYKLRVDLACQKKVENGIYIVQLPFMPAEKPKWDLTKMKPATDEVIRVFPEITRCLSCNVCTQACPQDIEVMRAVQALRRGDLEDTVNLTFDCISCGACSMRCPAELTHYQVFQLARRLYGKYETIPAKHLTKRVKEIEEGKFDNEVSKLVGTNVEELKELYKKREIEK